MEDYAGLLEPVFGRYGIPLFYSHRESILEKPILTLLTAALETVGDGYEYDSLFRYLKTGLTGHLLVGSGLAGKLRPPLGAAGQPVEPRGGQELAPGRVQPQMGRGGGRGRRGRNWTPCADGSSPPWRPWRKTQAAPGADLVRVLYGFLEDIQLPQRLQERSEQLRERGELRQAEEYRQLWGILCGAMEQCADLLTEGVMELREFADLFGLLLSQYDVSAIPVSLDRVSAGEIQHLSHKRPKCSCCWGRTRTFPLVTQAPGCSRTATGHGCKPSGWRWLHRQTSGWIENRCSFTKGWRCPTSSYLSAGPAPKAALPPTRRVLWNKSKVYCQN